MDAKEIIDLWCEGAHERELSEHKKWFWIARDIISGSKVSFELRESCLRWIKKNCKETEQKAIIIKALN